MLRVERLCPACFVLCVLCRVVFDVNWLLVAVRNSWFAVMCLQTVVCAVCLVVCRFWLLVVVVMLVDVCCLLIVVCYSLSVVGWLMCLGRCCCLLLVVCKTHQM